MIDAEKFFLMKLLTGLAKDGWKFQNRVEVNYLAFYAGIPEKEAMQVQPARAKQLLKKLQEKRSA